MTEWERDMRRLASYRAVEMMAEYDDHLFGHNGGLCGGAVAGCWVCEDIADGNGPRDFSVD